MKQEILNKFIEVLGQPTNINTLEEYIDSLFSEQSLDEYKESHHIFPKCVFGKDGNNETVYLDYKNHIKAHVLLAKCYPTIQKLIRPLNFMLSESDFKNNGFDEATRINRSNVATELWKDEKYRVKVLESRKEFLDNGGRTKMSETMYSRWNSLTEEQRLKFKDKMKQINSSDEKIKANKEGVRKSLLREDVIQRRRSASSARIGERVWNNGTIQVKQKDSPGEGWSLGGLPWWNDGHGNKVQSIECPGAGWIKGQGKRK